MDARYRHIGVDGDKQCPKITPIVLDRIYRMNRIYIHHRNTEDTENGSAG
jgi:hypothetical protein